MTASSFATGSVCSTCSSCTSGSCILWIYKYPAAVQERKTRTAKSAIPLFIPTTSMKSMDDFWLIYTFFCYESGKMEMHRHTIFISTGNFALNQRNEVIHHFLCDVIAFFIDPFIGH